MLSEGEELSAHSLSLLLCFKLSEGGLFVFLKKVCMEEAFEIMYHRYFQPSIFVSFVTGWPWQDALPPPGNIIMEGEINSKLCLTSQPRARSGPPPKVILACMEVSLRGKASCRLPCTGQGQLRHLPRLVESLCHMFPGWCTTNCTGGTASQAKFCSAASGSTAT